MKVERLAGRPNVKLNGAEEPGSFAEATCGEGSNEIPGDRDLAGPKIDRFEGRKKIDFRA